MSNILRRQIIRAAIVLLSIIFIAYLLPSLPSLFGMKVNLFSKNKEGIDAFRRSFLFAFGSTTINILLSLFFAIGMSKISLRSKTGKLISFLIIPVMLGNVSVAFIGKILFSDSAFFQGSSFVKFESLTLIQFWQYGTLYVYLFWLNIQNIPKTTLDYAQATKMNLGERMRDIILPSCKNIAILLFILNFILSIYEDAKIQLIFKSSVGTHTELISQWLNRTYQSNSLINPQFANDKTIQLGFMILILASIATVFSTFFFSSAYKGIIKFRRSLNLPNIRFLTSIYPVILLGFILLPLLYCIYSTVGNFNLEFAHLLRPLLFTLIASVIALIFSICIGILLRLGWKNTLSSFNNRSLFFFIFLFILQLVPPIGIYITGFQWLKITGYQSKWNLQLVWILGHVILTLPLLSSFISVSHFKTSNNEINYLESHKISLRQIIMDSFLRRYQAEYLLTFLIAFSLIWNESIVNNLLSDFIPSFVSEMKMNIEGRAADYAKGMNYLFVALGIALMAMWLWKLILRKSFNQTNEVA